MIDRPRNDEIPENIRSLVQDYCAGTLSDQQRVQLEDQLLDNERLQMYFLGVMAVHSGLYWSLRDQCPALPTRTVAAPDVSGHISHEGGMLGALVGESSPPQFPSPLPRSSLGWLAFGGGVLASAVVVTVAIFFFASRNTDLGEAPSAAVAHRPAGETLQRKPSAPTSEAKPVARIDKLESQVLIERAGAKQQAVVGMELLADDALDVPGGGSAELTFIGRARAKLGPRTTFVLGPGQEGLLREGFVQIDARDQQLGKSLEIETPDAEARIQDAWLAMGASGKRTQIRVAEGRVFASRRTDGIAVEIPEGHCSTIARAIDPQPRPSGNGAALFVVSAKALYAHEDWGRFDQILAERIVGDRLWRSAMPVHVRTYDELQAGDFDGCSLVVLSVFPSLAGIEQKLVDLKLLDLAIPIVCLEPAAFPVLGLTGPTKNLDFGFAKGPLVADIAAPGHPLAAGFAGTKLKYLALQKSPYAWGKPAPQALTVVRLHKFSDRSLLFAYDRGDAMVDSTAPARRVGLFMDPIGADYDSPILDLIDAAIDWCLESIAYDTAMNTRWPAKFEFAVDEGRILENPL